MSAAIEYEVKRKHPSTTVDSIIIKKCPLCGREGTLKSESVTTYGRRYIIYHEGYPRTCSFSWGNEFWDEIDRIYRDVRQNKNRNRRFW